MMRLTKQKGSVLIISLVLLLITTLLALSSMNNTLMEEKMVGNLNQQNLAFQSAEVVLREAEAALLAITKANKMEGHAAGDTGVWSNQGDMTFFVNRAHTAWKTDASNDSAECKISNFGSQSGTCKSFKLAAGDTASGSEGYAVYEFLRKVCDSLAVGQSADQQSCEDLYQITVMGYGPGQRSKAYLQSTLSRRY